MEGSHTTTPSKKDIDKKRGLSLAGHFGTEELIDTFEWQELAARYWTLRENQIHIAEKRAKYESVKSFKGTLGFPLLRQNGISPQMQQNCKKMS